MSSERFSTQAYLRARQAAVYEASGFVPKELKTKPSRKAKAEKAEKPKKEDTRNVTFRLYKQGLSVKQIAKERDLHQRTIYNHMAHFIAKGMLSVEEFVESSKCDVIRDAVLSLGSVKSLSAIKAACPEDVSYEEIILVIASSESEGA